MSTLLAADDVSLARLAQLEALGPPGFAVTLPSTDALPAALLELAVPHEEINTLVALLPTPDGTPELWWLLERCIHALVRAMGQIDEPPAFPVLPSQLGAARRYFYCYVFLAVLPHLRAFFHARAIPDDVLRATVADLGRGMAIYRRRYGEGGLGGAFWPALHFRGALFQLGRLQFQRVRLDDRTGRMMAANLPFGPGSPALDVHIPDFSGPLSPSACDASFARAKEFFARHFPEERHGVALCDSWLLDEQLAAYLPADANIVRFQRRFRDIYQSGEDDGFMIAAVFGRSDLTLDALPQRTTLERAIVSHLKSGGRWYSGLGWCAL
jgi:hypothetical protein